LCLYLSRGLGRWLQTLLSRLLIKVLEVLLLRFLQFFHMQGE
jgi:hypothetical protein